MSPQKTIEHTNFLGRFIKKRREQLNLLQREVAARMDLNSAEFIGLLEKGQRGLSWDRLPKLAEALETGFLPLARMAMKDSYPLFTSLLFKQFEETEEITQKLYELPKHLRQPLIDTIEHMHADHVYQKSKKRA